MNSPMKFSGSANIRQSHSIPEKRNDPNHALVHGLCVHINTYTQARTQTGRRVIQMWRQNVRVMLQRGRV